MRAVTFVVLLLCSACIPKRINWREVNARSDHSTLRHTPSGDIIGFVEIDGTLSWVGIPYGKTPVRWKAPKPFGRVDPIMFSATKYGAECPQLDENGAFTGDENCLTLNISARSIDDNKRPVIVWVHDGSKGTGTANEWSVMRRVSSRYGAVMVAPNYRLGALGVFKRPSLTLTDDTPADASGNYGTLDLVESLKWVRANIASFGGDPDNVTLFGSSEVFTLLASPLTNGLYQRAAIVDGLAASVTTEDAEKLAHERVLKLLMADGRAPNEEEAQTLLTKMGGPELANYTRAHPVEQVVKMMSGSTLPIRDGHVLPLHESSTARPPVLLGNSRSGENFERAVLRELGVMIPADALMKSGTKVFLFSYAGPDVASLVMGDEKQEEPARIPQSRSAMSYWMKFAMTGAPSKGMNDDLPEWLPAPRSQQLDVPQSTEGRESLDAMFERLWRDAEFTSDAARCEVARKLFPERSSQIAERCPEAL